jgi:hypothetical protein
MSTENGGNSPVATATPGSPIHVNVQLPRSAQESSAEPEAKSTPGRGEKSAKSENEKQRDKGTRRALKALGIPSEERDGLLKEIKETRQAKSLQEKLTSEHKSRAEKAEAELRLLKEQAGTYETLAKAYADEQFNALPESLQKFIAATAGDSLDARLKAIKTAKDSGLITAKEAAAASAQAKSDEKPAKPANTSAAVNPKAPPPTSTPTPKQQWEALRATNPRLAAQFYAANQISIDSDWS